MSIYLLVINETKMKGDGILKINWENKPIFGAKIPINKGVGINTSNRSKMHNKTRIKEQKNGMERYSRKNR